MIGSKIESAAEPIRLPKAKRGERELEKQKAEISKKLSKNVKAGIAIGTTIPVITAGVGIALGETGNLPGESQAVYTEAKDNVKEALDSTLEKFGLTNPFEERTIGTILEAQASKTIKPTETTEIKEVEKKIRGKINMITEKKLKEMQVIQVHRKYPQEVVYRNEVSGPEAMKGAV